MRSERTPFGPGAGREKPRGQPGLERGEGRGRILDPGPQDGRPARPAKCAQAADAEVERRGSGGGLVEGLEARVEERRGRVPRENQRQVRLFRPRPGDRAAEPPEPGHGPGQRIANRRVRIERGKEPERSHAAGPGIVQGVHDWIPPRRAGGRQGNPGLLRLVFGTAAGYSAGIGPASGVGRETGSGERMTEPVVEFGAQGIDTAGIVEEIRATVERKMRDGLYADVRVAAAERTQLAALRDEDAFADYYLQCLREAALVDINDFEIRERRAAGAFLLVRLKKAIWALLRFYTYRLWSQQNQVNSLIVTGLESQDARSAARIRALEARLAALEARIGAGPGRPETP